MYGAFPHFSHPRAEARAPLLLGRGGNPLPNSSSPRQGSADRRRQPLSLFSSPSLSQDFLPLCLRSRRRSSFSHGRPSRKCPRLKFLMHLTRPPVRVHTHSQGREGCERDSLDRPVKHSTGYSAILINSKVTDFSVSRFGLLRQTGQHLQSYFARDCIIWLSEKLCILTIYLH